MALTFPARKTKTLVGLDIEAGSIAATELEFNGGTQVSRTAVMPLEPGIFNEGEVTDPEALGEALSSMFAANKLGKRVRLGIANQRIAVRTLHLPPIEDPKELDTAIRFQAQDDIPMPMEQAVLDYRVVGQEQSPDGDRRTVAVVVAARRDMISKCMEALRDAGLRPEGIDLSAFGMIRALAREASATLAMPVQQDPAAPTPAPTRLYCNLGDVTNLAVARGSTCLFTRVSSFGIEGVAQRLSERRRLSLDHARQWLTHVGLERPLEQVEGDERTVAVTRELLVEGVAKLTDEVRLSLEFFGAQEGSLAVEGAVACGPGSAIPGLLDRLSSELGQAVSPGRPAALTGIDAATAARLTLSYGLALRN